MTFLVLAGTIALARPAAADICSDAPTPVAPKSGLPGMLTSTPKDIPDKAPDPFTDPSVPIGQVYGYNWTWTNFDLGCGSDYLQDPAAVTNTKTGNVILSVVGAVLAGLASLEQMAKASSLDWLTNVVGGIAGKLRGPVLALWLPLAMLGVGLIVGIRAKRSSYADTMRTLMIIVGAAALAVFALTVPSTASRAVDRAVVAVSDATGAAFSASPSDSITRESAYRTWLTGNFGDPDSAEAKELGPRLLNATHYTWSDWKKIQANPKAKEQIDHAKAAEFKSVADQLKQRDPAGYEVFTGRGERTGPAMFGVVVVLAMSLFVAMAMLLVLVARVMMQGLALAAPVAAVLGVLPTHTSVLARLWDLFAAALVSVAKFTIAGGVMAIVLGAIQANDGLGAGARLFWVLVATTVGIVLTRPVRSFKTIVPGLDPGRSYLRTAVGGMAGYFGARAAADDVRPEPGAPAGTGRPAGSRVALGSGDARHSLEPLPAPVWAAVDSSQLVRIDATGVAMASGQQSWDRGRAWPGVLSAPASGEPSATAELDRLGAAGPAADAAGSPDPESDDATTPVEPVGDFNAWEDQFTDPRAGSAFGAGVIVPNGILVGWDESPLYRRSHAADPGPSRLLSGERELAEDGSEQLLITYHSRVGASRASA